MEITSAIDKLPLKRTWLGDIVDVLFTRPNGTAEVQYISSEIMKSKRNAGKNPEETITRTINNYCRDSNDVGRQPKHDLFERVAPATYRLRTYPNRPDLIEIQPIEFEDPAHNQVWDIFCSLTRGDRRFTSMTKRQKLELFAGNIQPGKPLHPDLQAWMTACAFDIGPLPNH